MEAIGYSSIKWATKLEAPLRRKEFQKNVNLVTKCNLSADSVPPAWPGRAVTPETWHSWESGPKPISLVGSTGSIGTQVG